MLHKSCIFIWCSVPFEGHFLTIAHKCHSACRSGLDPGQKKEKIRWREPAEKTKTNTILSYVFCLEMFKWVIYVCVLVPC